MGIVEITGSPRETIQNGFKQQIIEDGEEWIEMMVSRNSLAHTYDEKASREIYDKIKNQYVNLFEALKQKDVKCIKYKFRRFLQMSNIKVTLEKAGIDKKEFTKFNKKVEKKYMKNYIALQMMKTNSQVGFICLQTMIKKSLKE